jgi:hypothetical protein
MIRKRNKLHKNAKETGSGRLKKKWKQLGSDIKSEITSSHNKYVANMIGNIKGPLKYFSLLNFSVIPHLVVIAFVVQVTFSFNCFYMFSSDN